MLKQIDFVHLLACAKASVCLGLRSPTRPLMLSSSIARALSSRARAPVFIPGH